CTCSAPSYNSPLYFAAGTRL
nr:TCR V beta 2/J beta 1.6 product=T-cell receptor beta chain variable region {CDR3 region, sample 1} [mice, SJL/J, kidney, Peptide Partial, 20 aa] [Mus sp.]